jgi:hypothetical protein
MFESLEREAALNQVGIGLCLEAETLEWFFNISFLHKEGSGNYTQIFTRRELRVPVIISIVVMITQQFTGCSAVFAYSTDMFINAGIDAWVFLNLFIFQLSIIGKFNDLTNTIQKIIIFRKTARFSTLAVGMAYFCFDLSAPFLIERVGRRILLIVNI